jgi:putative restriction endonuclease
MAIGDLPDIRPGRLFASRQELFDARVHRALQAGIVRTGAAGAESIVLSGGYPDDADDGNVITYTGHGGRDPNSDRQIADQTFTYQNQALGTSSLLGLPVRVIRGSGQHSEFAPSVGYRYDGLFRIERYWQEPGRDGFLVCRYRLIADPTMDSPATAEVGAPAKRIAANIQRIVRDTELGRKVKLFHDYHCQVCSVRLECTGGPYAEPAHIRPLGRSHDGTDELATLLCLCPNHHVLFDNGGFEIANTLKLMGLPGKLATARGHRIDKQHLASHCRLWGLTS